MKDAPRKVPQAMALGVVVNALLAFVFVIVILFFMGDPTAALTTTTGYPIIEIYYQATGSLAGATVLTSFIIIPATICQFSVFASVSRLVWAFARDNGLPFANFFCVVRASVDTRGDILC
jgi:choline transport protein